ncbi:hypothetical protein OBBRIDRAFT_711715, partial [Obba rivulosa]
VVGVMEMQTYDVNHKWRPTLFQVDNLVYLLTKNISLPRGYACKLVPKFIGPYKIL